MQGLATFVHRQLVLLLLLRWNHSLHQQMLTENPLCARLCSGPQGNIDEENPVPNFGDKEDILQQILQGAEPFGNTDVGVTGSVRESEDSFPKKLPECWAGPMFLSLDSRA